ncbi:glutathione S-transferase family protein [Teredinibacter waterburyi]|jgi:Glutathione S-transferase|uniref:glutathione S-transferase family protein n=1 Tax=Teredinibacter waterburyi TaxID=1500538 RepID=UPI00165F6315|nr:glutathione S-transferase family protein [Teredinibacter waterburyi]
MKIYGDIKSGNCYKIKLLASILDIHHQWQHVDILAKETQTTDFLSKNPNGKIPLLELANGQYLAESNAILNFLSEGTHLSSSDPFVRAQILQWQFFEQYSHEPYIAVARYIAKYLGLPEARRGEYKSKQAGGHKALRVMERQLKNSDYLVDNRLTIADISLYGYTHVAEEGGFDLSIYSAIGGWLKRIEEHPAYVGME